MGVIQFKNKISIISAATAAGKKECEGPLGEIFDCIDKTDRFGENSWEKSESEMQRRSLGMAIKKANIKNSEIDALYAGDLLNQCVGSCFGLVEYDIPFFGIYGACSTLGEGMLLASLMLDSGHAKICAAVCSSHNCSAERQFRFPLEYGGQRPPTAQWTVTGAGAYILSSKSTASSPHITKALVGTALDSGIKDANNMGAAMAPAAADTLLRFFSESGESPFDYDLILTGDLGFEGSELLKILVSERGLELGKVHNDCGRIIYHKDKQDVHCGGSGCGCSGIVFGSYILPKLLSGEIKKMLLCPTGALMNPASIQQGQSILGICHLLQIEAP